MDRPFILLQPGHFLSARNRAVAEVVRGLVDTAGLLIAADPALRELQTRAGGALGSELAVPALASMARLARTLNILVSRNVIVAQDDMDIDMLVRARTVGSDVELAIAGWTPRAPRRPWLIVESETVEPDDRPSISDCTWATDGRLHLTRVDGFGSGSDLLGMPLTRLFRLLEDELGDLPIIAALAEARDFSGQRAVLRDRPEFEIAISGRAIVDASGRFHGFEGLATGTAGKSKGDALPDLTPDTGFTERLDKALRAPLVRIVANADSIGAQAEGPLRRDYADYAGDIGSAARHLLGLVDDLTDLNAIERPDFAVMAEDIDLADIARRAAGLLQVRASDRGVRIDRPGTDETLPARGEFRRVLQILVNLIGNAVRYSPPDAMVWIRTERDADTAVLIVADQGKGIAIADQARIFDKFERVDASEPGGSGLGLFIARRLAQAMGGDITVDSAPGQGARFVLTLPSG